VPCRKNYVEVLAEWDKVCTPFFEQNLELFYVFWKEKWKKSKGHSITLKINLKNIYVPISIIWLESKVREEDFR